MPKYPDELSLEDKRECQANVYEMLNKDILYVCCCFSLLAPAPAHPRSVLTAPLSFAASCRRRHPCWQRKLMDRLW